MPKRKKDENGNEILTVREKLLVEGVAQGKSITEAGLNAGYSPNSAAQTASDTLKKPEIHRDVQPRNHAVIQAATDEVLQLFAAPPPCLVADFQDLFLEDDRLDLNAARDRGISRLIKKIDFEPIALTTVD